MDANVLSALDRQESGYKRPALNNVLIYGRVRCIIAKPSIVGNGVQETNGHFAIIDAYALKCFGEDYFREESTYDVNSVYFTKGSILIYIDSKEWVGKDVKVFGKSKYYGATIRRQNSKNPLEGISAFMFGTPISQGRKSVYPLVPNVLVELNAKDPDVRGTALEDFIVSIASNKGEIPYPETLDSIIPYTGVNDFDEIDINDVADNTDKTQAVSNKGFDNGKEKVDISKIDMKLTYHLEGQEQSKFFDDFKEDISLNAEARKAFVQDSISALDNYYSDYGLNDVIAIKRNFIERVASNPKRSLGGYSSIKCKQYIETFVDNCIHYTSDLEDMDMSSKSDNKISKIKTGIDKLKSGVMADSTLLYGGTDDEDIDSIPMLNNEFPFVVNVVGTCTGIGFLTLINNAKYCHKRMGISQDSWLFALLRCPYILGLLGIGLSVVDCDILYHSFGYVYDAGELIEINKKYRSYLLMLDTLDSCCKGKYKKTDRQRGKNTFIKIKDFKRADCCYPDKATKQVEMTGFMCKSDITDLLELLLDVNLNVNKNDIITKNWYSDEVFEELVEAGIVNTLDDYCALERNIEQEFMIYETFEKMGKLSTGISDDVIKDVIASFEEEKGFKLEALQKDGIKLCKNRAGVLSGCAGSGKTTTSDCMTEVLKTLGEEVKIIYCTPTGKACRRLAEVVHSTVKTIHSQFNVNIGGSSYLQGAYKRKTPEKVPIGSIYICDEMAMCSTELMYNIARNITDKDMIYFLGDVKQLPPIDGGCPFKVLMDVLPCVELGVSKRAAEGSLVNYNTSLINFMSDRTCKELLYDDKTFIAKDCPDASIAGVVKNVFSGFIDGSLNGTKYSEDDIQVISGYQRKERLSSTSRLNKPLQELLRKGDKVLYYKEVRVAGEENEPYYMNDRVIYVNKNSYDICRYIYDNGVFNQVATFGCVNGEMGKLVGIVRTSDAKIKEFDRRTAKAGEGYYSDVSEEELKSILERYDSKEDSLRSDGSLANDDYYFVIVKVYDTDLRRDVLVLLRGRGRYVDMDFCLSGSDLDNLNLAYALTCHKMQGSQSQVVIAAFESTGSPEFLNRNMINTIITRSQGVVCCVGSVLGPESMINKGRRRVSDVKSKDILSVLSDTATWLEG